MRVSVLAIVFCFAASYYGQVNFVFHLLTLIPRVGEFDPKQVGEFQPK